MRGSTHLYAGACVGTAWALSTGAPPAAGVAIIGISAFASLLPDVDTPTSKLGRRIPILSFLTRFMFGHRGMLHSILPWAAVWYLVYRIPQCSFLAIPGALATLSHLLLDAITPKGVPILWPIRFQLHLGRARTGGVLDFSLGITLAIVTAWMCASYFIS